MFQKLFVSLFIVSFFFVSDIDAQTDKKQNKVKTKSVSVEEVEEVQVEKVKGSAKKWMKKGNQLFSEGANYAAIEDYKIALSKTKKKKLKKTLFYKMGESAFVLRDYNLAESFYKSSLSIDLKKKKWPLLNYQFANSLKYQAKYVKAEEVYKVFVSEIGDNPKYADVKSKARLEAKGCAYAVNISPSLPKYTVENAGDDVNGAFADFGPEIRGKELVFSKILNSHEEGQANGSHVAKIYTSEMYNDKFNFAQNFSKILNEGEHFVCNPSFTSDNSTVYFTKCSMDNKMESQCEIYRSNLENGVWSDPVKLGSNINAMESSSSHPQIALDENGNEVLYFSSDRVGGRGGKDLWMAAQKEDGSFARAKNLGSKINSRFDEISPFYESKSGNLYYSTDGKISLGGFDIYVSTKTDEGWGDAVAMKHPINSSLDDYDFVKDSSGEFGFLVSNRVGTTTTKGPTCCDDIFIWRTTEIEIYLKGLVYAENKTSRELLKNANVVLKNIETGHLDSLKYEGESFVLLLDKNTEYQLVANNKDFEPSMLTFNTNGIVRSDTLQYDLFFKERKNFHDEVIGVIYYEYNVARLTKEAPKTLKNIVKFLETYPNTTVEITAHTDDKGAAKYNLDLSQERCLAAANYLDFQGISSDRIVLKWLGETQPVAPNTNKDGSDNPEGRSLNRRTEFKIVE